MRAPFQVTIDCANPTTLSEFWAEALGYTQEPVPSGYSTWEEFLEAQGIPFEEGTRYAAVLPPEGTGWPRVLFQRVPEPKTVKNRVHLDLPVADRGVPTDKRRALVEETIARLTALGAVATGPVEEHDSYWMVMQDPEGNEFCVF
jgi:hypothetical protein